MPKIFYFLIWTLIFLYVKGASFEEKDGVIVLNDEIFEEAIKTYPHIMVEFYAPWCGHCQKLAPEYARAAQRLAKEGLPVKLAKVDATINQNLHNEYVTKGYPTIKYFSNGQAIDYNGKRDKNGIVGWLKKLMDRTATELKSVEDVERFKTIHDAVVIGYFDDEKKLKTYKQVALEFEDVPAGYVQDSKVAEEGLKLSDPGIILFKKNDDEAIDFPDQRLEIKELPQWVKANKFPLVAEFSQEYASTIFGGDQKDFITLFYFSDDKPLTSELKKNFREAAKKFKGTVQFVQVDLKIETNDRIADFFGLVVEDIPTLRAMSKKEGLKKFKPEKDLKSVESMAKFTEDFSSGHLKVYLKSENIPEDWNQALVTVLVGKNFNEVARDPSKHVLVKFYAPWCPHCQKLYPAWDRLGKLYKDNENVVIAKMDATLNEVENITIRALPTISLFLKDSDKNVDYLGELEYEEILEFLVKETGEKPAEEEEEDVMEKGKEEKQKNEQEKHENTSDNVKKAVEEEEKSEEPEVSEVDKNSDNHDEL